MGHWLAAAFASYGYAVVVVGIFFEGCGLPLPGETVLLAGGFFARQGSISLPGLVITAFVAAVAGDNTGYWIGRRGGRGLVERHGRWVGLTPPRLQAVEGFFARHGTKTVLVARFLSGVRAFAPIFSGMSGLSWGRFAAFNAASCLLWSVSIGLLGYGFGESWGRAEQFIGRVGLSVLVLAASLLLLRIAGRHRERVLLWFRESLPGRLSQRQLWVLIVELTVLGSLARLAGRVVSHRYTRFDGELTDWLGTWTSQPVHAALRFFAFLGSAPVLLAVVAGVAAWCLFSRRRGEALVLSATYLASLLLSVDLNRAMAWWTGTAGLFSGLLSGNALVAATGYGVTALLLSRNRPAWRWPAALLDALLVLLIGLARIDGDLDLPSGVLAGLAVSSMLLVPAVYALDLLDANRLARAAARANPPPPAIAAG